MKTVATYIDNIFYEFTGLQNTTSNCNKTVETSNSLSFHAKLQLEINEFFRNFPSQEDYAPLIEFRHDNTNKLSKLLIKLDNAKGIKDSIVIAKKEITDNHVHPDLVKLAMAIYLTHNLEAQRYNVGPPPLHQYSQFKHNKVAPLSNPVTPDIFKSVELLSYFREDYDFNEHHWHWHIVYPYAGIPRHNAVQRTIKRQGELFLYMHSQMIARYNAELLSWGLNLLHAWGYDDILTFGYTPVPAIRDLYGARPPFKGWYENHNPHLNDSRGFPPRKTMIQWKDNFIQAIHNGYFVTNILNSSGFVTKQGKLTFTPHNAMNWVGVVIEAENPPLQKVGDYEYIDRKLYGSIHNLGHDKFAEIGYHEYTSPKNPLGVMISNFGSPRDPCFFLWHRHIDDFRQMIVNKYTQDLNEFKPNGVKITGLKIVPDNRNSKTPKGGIATYLEPPQLHLSEKNAKLNHEPYRWEITINATSQKVTKYFTVRLFIAPAELIDDQRSWIEMDKFTHIFNSNQKTITRKDVDSSVARKTTLTGEKTALSALSFCGWPQNMMLPVGKPGGAPYVAFAMLTNDKIEKVSRYIMFIQLA